jgi:tetratricopeptide (TPR) repeat protein
MTNPSLSLLDQTELIQLALTAGDRNDASSSLSYLKEAVSRPDANATAYFLLGSEYAEMQLYERAISAMETSLKLDPEFSIVRLQLGLLLINYGAIDKAKTTLQTLTTLDAQDPLAQFGMALVHLIEDDFMIALNCLHQGIAQNTENPVLNQNMQSIINAIKQLPENVLSKTERLSDESHAQHILLSAYTGIAH